MSTHFDALVIGSGVGGICTAARLAKAGYKTLVVESLPRLGGRASTREVDGFLLNTGGFAIERGGMVDKTRSFLGLPLELYVPETETVLIWGKRQFKMSAGLTALARSSVPKMVDLLTRVAPYFRPKKGEMVETWLNRLTRNKAIHQLIENVNCSFFAATNKELPADVFLHYIANGSSFKKIGFVPGGTIEAWKPMAKFIQDNGGEVWLDSSVKKITFDEKGLVNGAEIERNGSIVSISTQLAVSNAGPLATVKLAGAENFPQGYADFVDKSTDPSAIITIHFASQKNIATFPGLAVAAHTSRLTYAANFSAPELRRCPPGWHLYIAASSPRPSARGPFDLNSETELLKKDIREVFPGFDQYARILDIDVTAHDWPAQRAITGYDLPNATPVANLWNVGDGTKPWGDAGTASCAETARLVVAEILQKYPLGQLKSQLLMDLPLRNSLKVAVKAHDAR